MSQTVIVEDDRVSGTALCHLLRATGHPSSLARTLSEAAAKLDGDTDRVILDLMLPDGSGLSLLQRIRDEGLPIKVAVATATHDPALLAQVQALQPEVVFRKPLNVPAVLRWMNAS